MTQTATPEVRTESPHQAKLATKTKRVVNLRLLVISATVLLVSVILGYFWHSRQANRVADALLQRAKTLEQEEKWADAASYLTRYLQA